MRPSQALAVAAFLVVVPGSIWLAYAGFEAGLYPYLAVPLAFGAVFAAAIAALFVVLPAVRRRFG